jgi:2-C-methyl-D-erythritol 4-phosphate cytidylyltransferase
MSIEHTWAVVVAAGSGARFGGEKQFEDLAGRRVVDWSIDAARSVAVGLVVVVAPERLAAERDRLTPDVDVVVAGGATRSESVRNGLAAVPDDVQVVVVHDAARPLASAGLFDVVVRAVLDGADGSVPGLPVADTVKRVGPDRVVTETLERAELVAVQTPQAFRAAVLRAAHAAGGEATDDAALVERAGGRVVVVAGEQHNRKITDAADLDAMRGFVG